MKITEELERIAYLSGNTVHADLLARIAELEGEVENSDYDKSIIFAAIERGEGVTE